MSSAANHARRSHRSEGLKNAAFGSIARSTYYRDAGKKYAKGKARFGKRLIDFFRKGRIKRENRTQTQA